QAKLDKAAFWVVLGAVGCMHTPDRFVGYVSSGGKTLDSPREVRCVRRKSEESYEKNFCDWRIEDCKAPEKNCDAIKCETQYALQ
ncbi:hypothetical protein PENTCL1PPCAC_660, partial [Pristionchus entomophagus]